MEKDDVERTLEVMLKEYPDQVRFLRGAEYQTPNILLGSLYSDPSWAYSGSNEEDSPVNHFTLAESVFAHNQMAYVILACMAQEGQLVDVHKLSLDAMNKKKFNDILVIQYEASFREAFPSSEEFSAEFSVTNQKVKKTRSGLYLFTDNIFSFEGKKAYGESKIVVRLDENEVIKTCKL